MTRRGVIPVTPRNRQLVEQITGKAATEGRRAQRLIMLDGVPHRPNGRYVVGNVPVVDERGQNVTARDGDGNAYIVTKRHRFRIPKRHPWRARRPEA